MSLGFIQAPTLPAVQAPTQTERPYMTATGATWPASPAAPGTPGAPAAPGTPEQGIWNALRENATAVYIVAGVVILLAVARR